MKWIRYIAPLIGDKPGPWTVIDNTDEAIDRAKQSGAAFISTMAFEYEPEQGKPEPCRQGNFVCDFDCQEDPEIARQDCIKLVKYWEQKGVCPELLRFFVTGKKGVNVVGPYYLLGAADGDPLLPKIYAQMARYLAARVWLGALCSLDLSMYAMGKGKLLRMVGVRRDVGTYKVPVTWAELSEQPYTELIKLARAPRQVDVVPWDMKNVEALSSLYGFHKLLVHEPPASGLVDASKFIMRCAFVRHCIQHSRTLSEPEWHALISVLRGLGLRGRWLAHDFSFDYPEYDPLKANEKFDRVVPNISCDKIKTIFNCGCDCGVTTPSQLWLKASPSEMSEAAKSAEVEKLLKLGQAFDLYPSEDGDPYADIRVNGHRETYRVGSPEFRRLLSYNYYQETGKSLKVLAANDLINDLIARAIHGGNVRQKVFTRVAHLGSAVYLDLCDDSWRAIEITAEGWRVVSDPPVRFRRTKGLMPLPEPKRGGSIKRLRNLLNIEEDEAILLEGWLLGLLSPGPFPILILEGEQGTAKSTTTAFLRRLVDPSVAPTRATPRNEQDLIIAANNSHVVALDNLSGVPPWLSDALCRIATGGSFSARRLFTDEEEVLFNVIKPIVLNGIDQIAERHDLADRSLRVTLPVIPPERRLTKAHLDAAFAEAAPSILAGICEGASCALRNQASVKVENPPRMADFTAWCVAAEEAMPWEPGAFLDAYRQNQSESIGRALEADYVANAIMTLMGRCRTWEGTPTMLLQALDKVVEERVARQKAWPQTPSALGKRLTRSQAFLRKSGFEVERQRGGDHHIMITNTKISSSGNHNVSISTGEIFA
ncbi:MAG: hypothetical protein V3573_01940 [Desulfovibrionaceae bacterium]